MMNRIEIRCRGRVAALALLAFAPVAGAGPYGDDLSRCLVEKTTAQDRQELVRWIFGAVAAHPAVSSIVTVAEDQRTDSSRKAAGLFTRLLTEDCIQQTKAAVATEGEMTIQQSFQVLGQLAGKELFNDPAVEAVVAEMAQHLDDQKLEEAFGRPR